MHTVLRHATCDRHRRPRRQKVAGACGSHRQAPVTTVGHGNYTAFEGRMPPSRGWFGRTTPCGECSRTRCTGFPQSRPCTASRGGRSTWTRAVARPSLREPEGGPSPMKTRPARSIATPRPGKGAAVATRSCDSAIPRLTGSWRLRQRRRAHSGENPNDPNDPNNVAGRVQPGSTAPTERRPRGRLLGDVIERGPRILFVYTR